MKKNVIDEVLVSARKWDREYLEVTVHCLEHCERDSDRFEQQVEEFLSYRNRGAFWATNPHSKDLFLVQLLDEMRKAESAQRRRWRKNDNNDSDIAYAFVTFVHKNWATCDERMIFDLARAKQKVRNALPGLNFIAVFEVAPYKNEYWTTDGVKGKLMCWHCHALVWADSIEKIQRARRFAKDRFEAVLGKRSGMRVEKAREVEKAVAYMGKMPFWGKQTGRGSARKQARSTISLKSRHRLFQSLKNYTIFDLWFSGGRGRLLLRRVRGQLRQAYRAAPSLHKGAAQKYFDVDG